ncbi:hypothetical protein OAF63_00500 [Saprospiraceae bacterium]|nr:hypothetical protein [Bacteroidota bacterium]MDB4727241.1 hypothetical protein [Saprospiraceae bacterium]
MKISIYLSFVLLFMGIIACEQPIVFSEPQPERIPPSLSFHLPFRGTFFCEEDTSVVHVHNNCIFKEKVWQFDLLQENLDSLQDLQLINGQLFSDFYDSFLDTKILPNGSYRGTLVVRDTFFQIGKKEVLKYFRGYQVLNKYNRSGDWEIWLLGLDEYLNLTLHKTVLPEDLNKIKEITPLEDISTSEKKQYRMKPTIIEFSDLLNSRLIFEACGYYERIELEKSL